MWTASANLMIARLTGSALYANHHLASFFAVDHRSISTNETSNVVSKMRDLRARSPYALFLKDNYSDISAKYPDLKLTDISKKIAEVWKSLPEEKKQTYTKKSQDQKANYEQEKQRLSPTDLQTVDADQKARRLQLRLKRSMEQLPTKRPRSAYVHFLSTLDRGEADIGTFMKGAAQRWAQMTVDDKQKFEDLHQEEKQNYAKALVAWASSTEPKTKPSSRRSASTTPSTKTKDTPAKKTRGKSATGKRTLKKRTTSTVSAAKSSKTKSLKSTSDKEASSSSSDDESTLKTKKSPKTNDSKKS